MKDDASKRYTVGVISDTHGRLPASALEAFDAADLIIHAGDIGESIILSALETRAPVHAVRGNMDRALWARKLPKSDMVEVGSVQLYVLHDECQLDLDPVTAGVHVVISGHTHRPCMHRVKGVLHLNPGSASQARGGHGTSVALLHIRGTEVDAAIVELYS